MRDEHAHLQMSWTNMLMHAVLKAHWSADYKIFEKHSDVITELLYVCLCAVGGYNEDIQVLWSLKVNSNTEA